MTAIVSKSWFIQQCASLFEGGYPDCLNVRDMSDNKYFEMMLGFDSDLANFQWQSRTEINKILSYILIIAWGLWFKNTLIHTAYLYSYL